MRFLLLISTIIWHVASSEAETVQREQSEALRAAIQSVNTFGQKFDRYVIEGNKGNLVFSSPNAWILLSMAASGARQLTDQAVQRAFALPQNQEAAMSELQALTKSMEKYDIADLRTANTIFVDRTIGPKMEFYKMAKKLFHSEVGNVNFTDPNAARRIINDWVAMRTNNPTKDLVTPAEVNSGTSMVLASAVYSKIAWTKNQKFDFNRRLSDFHVNDTTNTKVNFTCSHGSHNWYDFDLLGGNILEIPLQIEGVSDALSMFVVESYQRDLAIVESNIEKLTMEHLSGTYPFECDEVCLPEFKIESEIEFNNVFKRIAADSFSKINDNFFCMSRSRNISDPSFVQKTVIDVRGALGAPLDVLPYGHVDGHCRIWMAKPFVGFIAAPGNISVKLLTFRYTGPTEPSTFVYDPNRSIA